MRKPAGRIHKRRDLYEDYNSDKTNVKVSYTLYVQVLTLYFTKLVQLLLTGFTWKLGYDLASIRIQKKLRKFKYPKVDFGETRKLQKLHPEIDKKELVVYYTDTFMYRYYWNKNTSKVPNRGVYKFEVTKGITSSGKVGNGRLLAKLLRDNPLAHLNFTD